MTRVDFIYRFKIHMNYADALVEVVNNALITKYFILICSVETLSMRRMNTGIHRVRQIEFTPNI